MQIRGESSERRVYGWAAHPRRAAHRGIEDFHSLHDSFFTYFVDRRLMGQKNLDDRDEGLQFAKGVEIDAVAHSGTVLTAAH